MLDAVTRAEEADYTVRIEDGFNQSEGTYPIEPFANYFVSRVKKDFNEGNTIVGGYLSSVNRSVEITYFEQLMANSSYLVGTDWEHSWSNRQWIASGSVSYSRVNGDESFITSLQQSPARYYQRVDGRSFSVDESATYLEGFAGEWSLNKASGEHWTGSLTYSMVTPAMKPMKLDFKQERIIRRWRPRFDMQRLPLVLVDIFKLGIIIWLVGILMVMLEIKDPTWVFIGCLIINGH